MSENVNDSEIVKARDVALCGFSPALKEQVDTIFESAGFTYEFIPASSFSFSSVKVALYYWPDRPDTARLHLQMLRRANQSPRIPIIVVAGLTTEKEANESVGNDADASLHWPFTLREFSETARQFCDPCGAHLSRSADAKLLSDIADSYVSVINRTLGVSCKREGIKLIDDSYNFRSVVVLSKLLNDLSGLIGITMSSEMADKLSMKLSGKKWLAETGTPDETGLQYYAEQVSDELRASGVRGAAPINCESSKVFRAGPRFGLDTRGEPFFAVQYFADEMPFEVIMSLRPKQIA